jgi:hypothetical protein
VFVASLIHVEWLCVGVRVRERRERVREGARWREKGSYRKVLACSWATSRNR